MNGVVDSLYRRLSIQMPPERGGVTKVTAQEFRLVAQFLKEQLLYPQCDMDACLNGYVNIMFAGHPISPLSDQENPVL